MARRTDYLPCQWCGDPGEEATVCIENADTGEVAEGSEATFITCRGCLDRFTREELGWPA